MFYFPYMFVGLVDLYVLLSLHVCRTGGPVCFTFSYMFVGLVDLYVLLSLHVCRTGEPVCFTFLTCL